MGLRTRLRQILGRRPDPAPASPPVGAPPPRAAVSTGAVSTGAVSTGAVSTGAVSTGAPPVPVEAGTPRRPPPPPPAEKVPDDKKQAAKLKAKKAVLQLLIREGGSASMKVMHDFSEARYFVAHRAFSDLMEVWLAEGLITWDEGAGVATITAEGRDFVARATHIQTREKD